MTFASILKVQKKLRKYDYHDKLHFLYDIPLRPKKMQIKFRPQKKQQKKLFSPHLLFSELDKQPEWSSLDLEKYSNILSLSQQGYVAIAAETKSTLHSKSKVNGGCVEDILQLECTEPP